MTAIAIRANFQAPAMPSASPRHTGAGGQDFSDALHAKSGVSAKNADADKNDGADLGHRVDPGAMHGSDRDQKVDKAKSESDGHGAKDDDKADDEKDDDEKDVDAKGGALPMHVRAERALVLAQSWQGANSTEPAPHPKGAAGKAAPETAGVNPVPSATGKTGTITNDIAATIFGIDGKAPTNGNQIAVDLPASGGNLDKLSQAAAPSAQALPAPPKTAGATPEPALTANPIVKDAVVSRPAGPQIAAASPTMAANAPALRNGSDTQPTPAQASTPAAGSPAGPGMVVSPDTSDGSAGDGYTPDDQAGADQKSASKSLQGATNQAATASGNTRSDMPLPTAQMTPASGSAASFAGAIARGGALGRYAAQAAAASMPGAPAGSVPVQSLRIQLRPIELGAVTANLKYVGKQLSIDVEVETSDAQRRLSSDSGDIVKSLQSLGFQVDKITVRQVQPHAQAQAQAMHRDASAGGFAGGQGNTPFSMSGHSERNSGGRQHNSENGYENGSEQGVGTVQPASESRTRGGVFI